MESGRGRQQQTQRLQRPLRRCNVMMIAELFLLLLLLPTAATATIEQSHRDLFGTSNYICSLTANIFRFEFDDASGLYVFKQENQNASNNNLLAVAAPDDTWQWNTRENDRKLRLLQESVNTNNRNATNSTEQPPAPFLDVRVCWCTEYALRDYEFCPVEFNTCLVPNPHRQQQSDDTLLTESGVGCFISHPVDTLARSFWPALVFWCVATLYALTCSEPGLYARQYVVRRLCGGCTGTDTTATATVERMLTEHPQRAAGLFRQHLIARFRRRRRQQQWGAWRRRMRWVTNNSDGAGVPNNDEEARDALVLKTRIFRAAEEDLTESRDTETGNEEESTRPQCAICILELEDGDRIGDIPCGHLLHKECLKDWLVRKNKCPLCQQAGVARLVVQGDTTSSAQHQPHRNRILAAAAAAAAASTGADTATASRQSSEGETSF